MPKKQINVKGHIRKLNTGKLTNVKQHKRQIDHKVHNSKFILDGLKGNELRSLGKPTKLLSDHTYDELYYIAKNNELKGYSQLNKEDLIKFLEKNPIALMDKDSISAFKEAYDDGAMNFELDTMFNMEFDLEGLEGFTEKEIAYGLMYAIGMMGNPLGVDEFKGPSPLSTQNEYGEGIEYNRNVDVTIYEDDGWISVEYYSNGRTLWGLDSEHVDEINKIGYERWIKKHPDILEQYKKDWRNKYESNFSKSLIATFGHSNMALIKPEYKQQLKDEFIRDLIIHAERDHGLSHAGIKEFAQRYPDVIVDYVGEYQQQQNSIAEYEKDIKDYDKESLKKDMVNYVYRYMRK